VTCKSGYVELNKVLLLMNLVLDVHRFNRAQSFSTEELGWDYDSLHEKSQQVIIIRKPPPSSSPRRLFYERNENVVPS